jgi:GxxExxY protein
MPVQHGQSGIFSRERTITATNCFDRINGMDRIDGITAPRAPIDDPITEQVIGLAMKVHRVLGPGFLESVYRKALLVELRTAGLVAEEGKRITVMYDGISVGEFISDIIVGDRVVVELKAVEAIHRMHELQTLNYLSATGLEVGLLINFGSERLQFKRKHRRRPASRGAPKSREGATPVILKIRRKSRQSCQSSLFCMPGCAGC